MKTNRRSFIKGVTGFVAGVVAAFVPKAKGWKMVVAPYNGNANSDDIEIVGIKVEQEQGPYLLWCHYCNSLIEGAHLENCPTLKSSNMRPVTGKDKKDYCVSHVGRECAFRNGGEDRCTIDSWKEMPCRKDVKEFNTAFFYRNLWFAKEPFWEGSKSRCCIIRLTVSLFSISRVVLKEELLEISRREMICDELITAIEKCDCPLPDGYTKEKISHVKFHNRVLSPEEIKNSYNKE